MQQVRVMLAVQKNVRESSLDQKLDLIRRYESSQSTVVINGMLNLSESISRTINRNKEKMKHNRKELTVTMEPIEEVAAASLEYTAYSNLPQKNLKAFIEM